MAKMTVLEITQSALRNMGSDPIESIDDTEEATEVANIAKEVYEIMAVKQDWPHLRTVVNLTSPSDSSKPTHLQLDDTHQEIDPETIYYDKREDSGDDPLYERVRWCDPDQFLRLVLPRGRNLSDSNVEEVTDPVKFYVYNDRAPTYCTSFDDETIIFDSYDSDVDTNFLDGSKSTVVAYKESTFTVSDGHTPDIPSKNFPQYLAEVKAATMAAIGQEIDRKQEVVARELSNKYMHDKWRAKPDDRKPDYGRQPRSTSRVRWRSTSG